MDIEQQVRRVVPDRFESLVSGVRFGQFVSVGVVGAISDNTVLAVLGLAFGVSDMWAKAAGVETAILVMFLVNEHWTFAGQGDTGRRSFAKRLGKSHLVRSGGVAVQLAVYWLLTQWLTVELVVAGTDLWFIAASPLAIGVAMLVNYVAESIFTWQVHADE
ncbi:MULTISPECIES: GtrA family protein [Haloarcula]|uniref:GtrA family protein n=3 Tax=Haloarcula hispanica TaxID=51589 RepID=A0A482T7D1_HALHI|nr:MULTISPECIES: GtrA family protein [Haloarcula]AEM56360.1 GtrA-like family protein [Haloarcula hispanica ATCC 33960]AHB65170.1 sugar translocase [Haloarcula hispanica N601]AJF27440.1 sugar translocase [Haloarcula sp. CBA1115]KAA9411160.1 GtrA family protein [Haloarcula hispanica]KZX48031.1 sugar translocase [Haloarcula sp. K1]